MAISISDTPPGRAQEPAANSNEASQSGTGQSETAPNGSNPDETDTSKFVDGQTNVAIASTGNSDNHDPAMTVGQILKAARQAKNLDLDAMAELTKVRRAYLSAIEESVFDDLPANSYAVGFVKIYANNLGLDTVDLAARFRAEMTGPEAVLHQSKVAIHPSRASTLSVSDASGSTPKSSAPAIQPHLNAVPVLGIIGLIGVCIFFVWTFIALSNSNNVRNGNGTNDIRVDNTASAKPVVIPQSKSETVDVPIAQPAKDDIAASPTEITADVSTHDKSAAPADTSAASRTSSVLPQTEALPETAQQNQRNGVALAVPQTDATTAPSKAEPIVAPIVAPEIAAVAAPPSPSPSPSPLRSQTQSQAQPESQPSEQSVVSPDSDQQTADTDRPVRQPKIIRGPRVGDASVRDASVRDDSVRSAGLGGNSGDVGVANGRVLTPSGERIIVVPTFSEKTPAGNSPISPSATRDPQSPFATDSVFTPPETGEGVAGRPETPADDINDGAIVQDASPQIELVVEEPASTPLFTEATLTNRSALDYPARCNRRARASERVRVQFAISALGIVQNPSVLSSSNSCFNGAALEAVQQFRYNPRLRDGRPVATASHIVTLRFDR